MNINDISSFEIIEAAWNTLPDGGSGGWVFVVVDTRTGKINSIYEPQGTIIPRSKNEEYLFMLAGGSKNEIVSNLVIDEDILTWEDIRRGKTRYDLNEDELYSSVLKALHERHEKFIKRKIKHIIEKHPHLV